MYIGLIISLGIFTILSQAVITLVVSAYDLIIYTRTRTVARHLVEEELEIIRNAPYDQVGTVGGIPAGNFKQEQTTDRNGLTYTLRTTIVYIDDPFDGFSPTDTLPVDYKRVRVDAYWGGVGGVTPNKYTLYSDIAPRGVETIEGGGTLSVLVFDAGAEPVPQASVRVVASSASPPVDQTYQTNDNGRVVLPGAPICNSCYEITVTKSGYSTDKTYGTASVANPVRPHATILEAQLTEVSFAIDQFASLTINTYGSRDNNFPPLGGQVVRVYGDKIIGTDSLDNNIYKFDQEIVTDTGGGLSIDELEWDNYHFEIPEDSTYNISGTNIPIPLLVAPNQDVSLLMALEPESDNNLLVTFTDVGDTPIASVSAQLKLGPVFTASESSGISGDPDFGQIFFDTLNSATYVLEATAGGFVDFSGNINVSGATLETIILNSP